MSYSGTFLMTLAHQTSRLTSVHCHCPFSYVGTIASNWHWPTDTHSDSTRHVREEWMVINIIWKHTYLIFNTNLWPYTTIFSSSCGHSHRTINKSWVISSSPNNLTSETFTTKTCANIELCKTMYCIQHYNITIIIMFYVHFPFQFFRYIKCIFIIVILLLLLLLPLLILLLLSFVSLQYHFLFTTKQCNKNNSRGWQF